MITLTVTNGQAFVWNAEDWLDLRETHRIVGDLIGCLAHLPRQETFAGLPLALLPEEATLLVQKSLARLVRYPSLSRAPEEGVKVEFEKLRDSFYVDQAEYMKDERKKQVISMIDRIVEGKRKKHVERKCKRRKTTGQSSAGSSQDAKTSLNQSEVDEDIIDKEALLKEELDKIVSIPKSGALIQTFTSYPWLREEDACSVKWGYPSTPIEKIRYHVFKDLWEQGYYLTAGNKFGGDYLVYPGDPLKFHAQFVVICKEQNENIPLTDLVACGRLGSSVRKTIVLASLSGSEESPEVVYQSIKWFGSV